MTPPLVIAHRTCPLDAPENSIEGIRVAARLGADAVEIDVRRTRDGELVLSHDPSTWRLARRPAVVRWTHSGRLRADAAGRPVRLRDVLRDPTADLPLAVDLKDAGALEGVVAMLRDAGRAAGSRLWIRSPAVVKLASALAPECEVALLRNTRASAATLKYLDAARDAGAAAVSLHQDAVTESVVARAHSLGLIAYAWVIALDAHAQTIGAGVDGVVTDWPTAARAEFERQGS